MGQHDWGLSQTQGAGMLTRLLWPHLGPARQEAARTSFRRLLAESFRLYRPESGGFAYYSTDARADLDGTGLALGLLRAAGALPGTWERTRLWGPALAHPPLPGAVKLKRWEDAPLPRDPRVQSIRIFADRLPEGDAWDVPSLAQILYPGQGPACDVMDLRQRVQALLEGAGPAFGNWTSRESLRRFPLGLETPARTVPVSRGGIDWGSLLRAHGEAGRFFAVGYDAAQVPVACLLFELEGGSRQGVPAQKRRTSARMLRETPSLGDSRNQSWGRHWA